MDVFSEPKTKVKRINFVWLHILIIRFDYQKSNEKTNENSKEEEIKFVNGFYTEQNLLDALWSVGLQSGQIDMYKYKQISVLGVCDNCCCWCLRCVSLFDHPNRRSSLGPHVNDIRLQINRGERTRDTMLNNSISHVVTMLRLFIEAFHKIGNMCMQNFVYANVCFFSLFFDVIRILKLKMFKETIDTHIER